MFSAFYLRYYGIAVSGTLAYAVGEGENFVPKFGSTVWGVQRQLFIPPGDD
jgi:hypothetical protein